MTKKVFRVIWKILLAIIILAAAGLLFMTITEYRPQSIESVTPADTGASRTLSAGDSVTVLSWNVGYSGLGSGSDFFMDGGKNVRSADKATVQKYLPASPTPCRTATVSPTYTCSRRWTATPPAATTSTSARRSRPPTAPSR
jgi:hypothetical protein